MTERSKTWYLVDQGGAGSEGGATRKITVFSDNLPMKVHGKLMGQVLNISKPKNKEKYNSSGEGVIMRCENGKYFLKLADYDSESPHGIRCFRNITTADQFLQHWGSYNCAASEACDKSPTPQPQTTPVSSAMHTVAPLPSIQTPSAVTKKRPLGDTTNSIVPPSKRLEFVESGIDEQIERCKIGIMELPIANIFKPPKCSRLLREPDKVFIGQLKASMRNDPSAPGATNLAVLCKDMDSADGFEVKHKNVYSYEVLGGLHTLLAKSQLLADDPSNLFYKTCIAEVYVGLTDEQSLRLSQRHNKTSHFVHAVTHRDMVEACRARLFKMACLDMDKDETPKPTAAWRESCKTAIIPEKVSKTQIDTIFSQASLPRRVWLLAVQVMNKFKKCQLKDMDKDKKFKNLRTEPDFKQQYLTPIRTLSEDQQCHLLQELIDCRVKITELKEAAAKIKQMTLLKNTFLELTAIKTWEEAQEMIPQFATTEQLGKFSGCDIKKSVPQFFKEFCSRAKSSLDGHCEAADITVIHGRQALCKVLHSKFTELCGNTIATVFPTFTGVQLTAVSFGKEATSENIASISYTIKEINSINAYETYTVVGICEPPQLPNVIRAWKLAFKRFDVLYYADEDSTTCKDAESAESVFTSCVKLLVFGFFSANNGNVKETIFFEPDEQPKNFLRGSKEDLYIYLIDHFSMPGNLILDMTETEGMLSAAAVCNSRNAICITEGECNDIITRLNKQVELE